MNCYKLFIQGKWVDAADGATLAAFALGLMLFIVTLILNVIGLSVVRKYREQYD